MTPPSVKMVKARGVGGGFDAAVRPGIVQLMKFLAYALIAALSPLPALASVMPAPGSQLTGQDAVYSLSLSKLRTHDITGATGRLRLQVLDGCTGWASYQHMTLIIRNVDGSLTKSISDYTTWESKDGKTLTFRVSQGDGDGKMQVTDAGTAIHTGPDNRGVVRFTVPANTEVKLPAGTLFPIQHMMQLLNAGQARKAFIAPLLFDGTSTDGAESTFITVFGYQGPENTPWPALDHYASTDANIAFFSRTNQDSTPEFSSSMRYFENGVTTDLVLDFGDFVMNGKLESLTIPKSACPAPPNNNVNNPPKPKTAG